MLIVLPRQHELSRANSSKLWGSGWVCAVAGCDCQFEHRGRPCSPARFTRFYWNLPGFARPRTQGALIFGEIESAFGGRDNTDSSTSDSLRLIGARSTSDSASEIDCAHAAQRRVVEDPK